VAEAITAGVEIDALYVEPGADLGPVSHLVDTGVDVIEVGKGSLRKVLDLVNPQAMVALARQRPATLAEVVGAARERSRPVLALIGLQDPGNAGTLVRVAEAAGCAGVVLTEGSVDPWNPKVVRASAGALFRVPVVSEVDAAAMLSVAEAAGLGIVATVATEGKLPEATDLAAPSVLLVGAEAHGLPPEVEQRATIRATIPMEGAVESLNAGIAGALLAFEAARQRRGASGESGSWSATPDGPE